LTSTASTPDDEFRDFMASRWPILVRTAYLLTGSHHDAEDLAQTALTRAHLKWRHVRRSDDPAAYVRQIMIHCHADQFRRRRVREWLTARLPDTPAPHSTTTDTRHALMQALGQLPARQRAVVVLYYFEDMPHAQIAAALGTKEATVRSQLSRALAKLRDDTVVAALTGRTAAAPHTELATKERHGR
jgi:RNA polymerase sigma-70 factor (sigma-E family)